LDYVLRNLLTILDILVSITKGGRAFMNFK
jgi:hypothetical protein